MVGCCVLNMGFAFTDNSNNLRNSAVTEVSAALDEYDAIVGECDQVASPSDAVNLTVEHHKLVSLGAARIDGFGRAGSVPLDVEDVCGTGDSNRLLG